MTSALCSQPGALSPTVADLSRLMIKPLLSIAVVGVCACSRPSPRALYTEEDVRAFVQPGTSREAIIKRFGEPLVDDKNPKFEGGYTGVDEIMFFHLPFETQRRPRTDDLIFSGSRRSFVHHFVS